MEWLAKNWFWVLIGIVFVAAHMFGHGGHGGHGKPDGSKPDGDRADNNRLDDGPDDVDKHPGHRD